MTVAVGQVWVNDKTGMRRCVEATSGNWVWLTRDPGMPKWRDRFYRIVDGGIRDHTLIEAVSE